MVQGITMQITPEQYASTCAPREPVEDYDDMASFAADLERQHDELDHLGLSDRDGRRHRRT